MLDFFAIIASADRTVSRREMNGQLVRFGLKTALRHFSN